MKTIHYNSKLEKGEQKITATYNGIDPTLIRFENENISATINSIGRIEFFDPENRLLCFVDAPAAESADLYAHTGQYSEVLYSADGSSVCFHLPVYYWIDHYPHCDGEYDRWSKLVARWRRVVFDCKMQSLEIIDG